ncbi:MAG: PKD domain-containing protein, partial [Pseudomonadales bacterium]
MGHVRETLRAPAWALLATTMAACSGGGGGGDDGGGQQSVPNQDPIASFTASVQTGDAPLTVIFDATASSDSDGSLTSFNWDFGDTSTAIGSTTTHTFAQPGTFTVVLTVQDDDAATDTTSMVITANQAANTFQLSGTMSPLTSSAVDGDVNDPFSPFLANDAMASAQAIPNPVTLGGYVNIPGTGPTGRSKVAGDPADFYMITLAGNETIILSIADANALVNDLDLRLRDTNGLIVDESIGIVETEVIQAPGPGTFFLEVIPFAGASNYVLAIGDQTAQIVSEDMTPLRLSSNFRPGEIVLQVEPEAVPAKMQAMIAAEGLVIARDGGEFKLLEVPSPRLLATGMDALPMDPSLREKHETLMALKAMRK